jgi:hypothetical protein
MRVLRLARFMSNSFSFRRETSMFGSQHWNQYTETPLPNHLQRQSAASQIYPSPLLYECGVYMELSLHALATGVPHSSCSMSYNPFHWMIKERLEICFEAFQVARCVTWYHVVPFGQS